MSINTYGRVMTGLEEASSRTEGIYGTELYIQISYDLSDGEVLTRMHLRGDWSQYHSDDIIHVVSATCHLTQQQIADKINAAASFVETLCAQYAAQ